MPVIEITDLSHPALMPYAKLTETQLRRCSDTPGGLFIAESPKVIERALDAGCIPQSILCEERHITGDAAAITNRCGNVPVYTGSRELLSSLTGYTLTRGVLCAMHRPALPDAASICTNARRIAVIAGVVDATNIGAIFRAAAALGMDAVLLTPDSCDPLNRRASRVSMGTVFQIPWTWLKAPLQSLNAHGFRTVAMALTDASIPIDAPELQEQPKLAIVMGTEGDGLPQSIIDAADYTVRIPMKHNVDSLNVAAAASIAFWQLRDRNSL